MTPEASRFLDKANRLLGEADTMLGVGLKKPPGARPISPRFMSRKRSSSSER